MSGKGRRPLIVPSGPTFATVGVLMHYPTFVKSNREFWDLGNPCIKRMMKKGFNATNTFGFDLHWRQEHSYRQRQDAKCPKDDYPTALLALHDEMTEYVLKSVPMPLLLVVGGCAWRFYRRLFKGCLCLFTLMVLADHNEVTRVQVYLQFDASFGTMQRFIISCNHPDSIYRSQDPARPQRAGQMNCAAKLSNHFAMPL